MNQVIFKGSLGRDARINNVGNRRVANFTVATEYNVKKADGNYINETTWLNIGAWEGYGICPLDLLVKGVKVSGMGRLRTRKYTDNSGEEHEVFEVVCDTLDIIDDSQSGNAKKPTEMKGNNGGNRNYYPTDDDEF